jgi:hypothetical protein
MEPRGAETQALIVVCTNYAGQSIILCQLFEAPDFDGEHTRYTVCAFVGMIVWTKSSTLMPSDFSQTQ